MPDLGSRILYVDDDPGIGRLVRRALESRGYAVEHVLDGQAGVERIRQGGIALVALDHHMPGQTGLDVLPVIRALPDAPPVIYVTGSEDSRVAVAALKAGAVDYVWKDVQGHFRELLAEAVTTALEQHRLRLAKEQADRDIRAARDRAEVLLREVNHRVANSLALVAAMARMQSNALTDPGARAALEEMQARVTAIANIHRRLYTSDDVRVVEIDAYLASLVEELEAAMKAGGGAHRVELDLRPVSVATDKAVSVGVIVTELVTNAFKYAFPEGKAGRILIALKEPAAGRARLVVEDDGVGMAASDGSQGTGLGTRIVTAMARNLGSKVAYEDARPGTRAVLEFSTEVPVYEGEQGAQAVPGPSTTTGVPTGTRE